MGNGSRLIARRFRTVPAGGGDALLRITKYPVRRVRCGRAGCRRAPVRRFIHWRLAGNNYEWEVKSMMYRVPMPTKANGVKIMMLGDHEVGIQYTTGKPHIGKMAFDSAYGITSKITFRRPSRYYDAIVADAVRQVDAQDALPPDTGIQRSKGAMKPRNARDNDDDDDTYADPQEVAGKVMSYLKDLISPEDLEAVNGLLMGTEEDEAHEGRRDAADRARDRGLAGRQARRQAMDADFAAKFPGALKILNR
jgi:hypothetical protein